MSIAPLRPMRLLQDTLVLDRVLGQGAFGVAQQVYSPVFGWMVAKVIQVSSTALHSIPVPNCSLEGCQAASNVNAEHADNLNQCTACLVSTPVLDEGLRVVVCLSIPGVFSLELQKGTGE